MEFYKMGIEEDLIYHEEARMITLGGPKPPDGDKKTGEKPGGPFSIHETPDNRHAPNTRALPSSPRAAGLSVLIITAGTTDIPVASEALLTLQHSGTKTHALNDCGVAGLHRIGERRGHPRSSTSNPGGEGDELDSVGGPQQRVFLA